MQPADLGVPHLRRMFEHARARLAGRDGGPADAQLDRTVLDVLGVGREPALQRLFSAATLEEFTAWIAQCNGGRVEAWRLARAREVSGVAERDPAVARRLAEIDAAPPALSGDDLHHWEEHGYVVLRGAIPPELCERIECATWASLGADPADPDTWYERLDAVRQGIMVQLFDEPAQREARELPRIHKAFAQLWGTADLVMTTDRAGFNPPERRGWRFPGPHLHWDLDSWDPPIAFATQGIAYLTDTPAEQGAFRCVPGFHRRIEAWLDSLPEGADPKLQDLEALGAEPIPGRAGDLVIWNNALPHGASPNRGSRPRIVQYMKMYAPAAQTGSPAA